jgi:predicted MFS family arabinose efflux permease
VSRLYPVEQQARPVALIGTSVPVGLAVGSMLAEYALGIIGRSGVIGAFACLPLAATVMILLSYRGQSAKPPKRPAAGVWVCPCIDGMPPRRRHEAGRVGDL